MDGCGLTMPSTGAERSIVLEDYSQWDRSAAVLFEAKGRDTNPLAARLAEQFITQNHSRFAAIGISASTHFVGSDVRLRLTSSNMVGAVPAASPLSAKNDLA
ncbi:MAG: hypothetical protein NVS9B15_26500 [Acidobacteriaceae bacterium]